MLIRILFLICSPLFFISSSGQNFIVQELSTDKVGFFDNSSMISFSDGYYSVKNSNKARLGYTKSSTTLVRYDRLMNVTKTHELFTGTDRPVPFPAHFEKIDGKEIFIYYQKEETPEVIDVYVAEIDPEKLEPINSKRILQIKGRTPEFFHSLSPLTRYKLIVQKSPDGQKTIFLWHSGIGNLYTYCITDRNMNIVKNKSEEIKQASSIYLSNACIDNEGNVFVAYFYTKENKRVWNVVKNGIDDKSKNINIDIDNNTLPVNVFISYNVSTNEIKICGTYTKNGYYISGAFMQILDGNTMIVSNLLKKDVPENLMNQYIEDDFSEKKESKMGLHPEMTLTQLIFDDKIVCLTGEITKIETVRHITDYKTYNVASAKSITKGGILSILFKESDILFNNVFKRELTSEYEDKSYFYPFINDNKVVFLYVTNKSDIDKTFGEMLPSKYSKKAKTFLISSIINKNGEVASSIVAGDINTDDYRFDTENILNSNAFPILLPFKKSTGILKENITYYSLQITAK